MKSFQRILADLEISLRRYVTPARELIAMGWRDFRNVDRPQTTDAVTLGCEAFLYLSINEDNNWRQRLDVLKAVIAYLNGETGHETQEAEFSQLVGLLREKPVRIKEVKDWFDNVYR